MTILDPYAGSSWPAFLDAAGVALHVAIPDEVDARAAEGPEALLRLLLELQRLLQGLGLLADEVAELVANDAPRAGLVVEGLGSFEPQTGGTERWLPSATEAIARAAVQWASVDEAGEVDTDAADAAQAAVNALLEAARLEPRAGRRPGKGGAPATGMRGLGLDPDLHREREPGRRRLVCRWVNGLRVPALEDVDEATG